MAASRTQTDRNRGQAPRESSGGARALDQSKAGLQDDHEPGDLGQRLNDRRGGVRVPPPPTGDDQKP
jgi:hypothetical protein